MSEDLEASRASSSGGVNDPVERDAREIIATVERELRRWEAWFPDDMSSVEVPRRHLLALMHYAEIGLRSQETPP